MPRNPTQPFVLPETEQKPAYVRGMFDSIAPRYDLLNSLLSLGLHHGWRRHTAWSAGLRPGDFALDICTGTGDLAFELARYTGDSGRVIGADFARNMLDIGVRKDSVRVSRVHFVLADAQQLPFPDNTFHAATMAFGLRNVANREKAVAEMARVVRPGGRVLVLEAGKPRNPLIRPAFRVFSLRAMPILGAAVAGNEAAYTYLPASIDAFPARETVLTWMRSAGLRENRFLDFCLGTVVLYTGFKPDATS